MHRTVLISLWILAAVSLAFFAYPVYVIRPFRAQGEHELALALAVKLAAPWVTILFALAAAACTAMFWRRWRWPGKVGASLATLAAIGALGLAHFNVYEQMFHPIGQPAWEAARTAKIDADDTVIAVKINGSARAYPVRTMGYHHIANDWVGGDPIVATY